MEFKSWDAIFLENEFQRQGDIREREQLHEVEYPDFTNIWSLEGAPESSGNKYIKLLNLVGANCLSKEIMMLINLLSRVGEVKKIPHHCFEIEDEALIITSQDDEEPQNMEKSLTYPNKEHWKKQWKKKWIR